MLWQSSQCAACPPSSLGGSRALLEDFAFSREEIPRHTSHVLECHADEVWLVAFSHNGHYLASAAKDALIALWEVPAIKQARRRHRRQPSPFGADRRR